MDNTTHYWYARGYFDGRCGHPDRTDTAPDLGKVPYNNGHKVGDADWRMLDKQKETV